MTVIRSAIECVKNSQFRAQPKSSVALLLSSSLVLAVTSEELARWSQFTLRQRWRLKPHKKNAIF
ncbi:hypothetical protein NC651_015998 [Populus alba x Populus x berolinensis]|nr:hypothetical protein NC651_015998 [Populus alba x Populus x berolinensis]